MSAVRPVKLAAEPAVDRGGADPAEIGGKAASLLDLSRAGFRVPEAVVLPVAWFSAWWSELEANEAWAALDWAALQKAAARFVCTPEMSEDLDELRKLVASWGAGATCAVRSSSPDEDLETASFAGGYVSVLGVQPAGLEEAVRACFVSVLDERVAAYKQQHGFDLRRPRMAVLVQRQVHSDVAGVGFSLNPVTNDFDEAVIDASFGLGESVVTGDVSPDHFVVDKPARKIVERHTGAKQHARWVRPEGGVELREDRRGEQASLRDEQVLELTDALVRLEAASGHPVDIEWAYANEELQLLQARPVTAYVPLPVEMLTEPGARRRLYADAGLTDKLTINAPITTLTLDALDLFFQGVFGSFGLSYDKDGAPEDELVVFGGSRTYMTLSHVFWWLDPKKMAASSELNDALLARTLENVDRAHYRPSAKPAALSWGRIGRMIAALFRPRGLLAQSLLGLLSVPRMLRRFRAASERFEKTIRATRHDAPVSRLLELHDELVDLLMRIDLPVIMPWGVAIVIIQVMQRRADPETAALLDRLNRGYEGELVVEMGIEMFAMTRLLDAGSFDDLELLQKRIKARDVPGPFLTAWDAFVERFGARGPLEMDLRSPRYGDTPALLLRQMSFLAKASADADPALTHAKHVRERKQAYAELMRRSGWFRRVLLRLAHRWIEACAGERDTPKHHWAMLGGLMRRSALAHGARLVKSGRLDETEDVFHLTWKELEIAERDEGLDLRSLALARRSAFRRVEALVKEFPHLIDSRGRIMRPAPSEEDGDLKGLGISPGVARGPVKVLRDPYEKEIEPGDVLVAYTTDPGWTPLFINASAIVLQIGGMTQHGGVVAREYGKPCVAGIERVLSRFEDGQLVEVDGSAGVVRAV